MLGYWKVKKVNAPTFFKGEHVAEISSKMRSFYAWQNKISGVIGYYIYKSSSGGAFDSDPINKCIITDTSYVDSNVRKDQTYSYYVTAVNKYEVESEPSDAITIEVKPFESDKLSAFIIIALSISLFLVVTVFIVYVIRQKRKIS